MNVALKNKVLTTIQTAFHNNELFYQHKSFEPANLHQNFASIEWSTGVEDGVCVERAKPKLIKVIAKCG